VSATSHDLLNIVMNSSISSFDLCFQSKSIVQSVALLNSQSISALSIASYQALAFMASACFHTIVIAFTTSGSGHNGHSLLDTSDTAFLTHLWFLLAISCTICIASSVGFHAIFLSSARLQRLHTSPSHVSFNTFTIFFASLAFTNHCTANHSASFQNITGTFLASFFTHCIAGAIHGIAAPIAVDSHRLTGDQTHSPVDTL
jgi:hypothetical protein